MTRVAHLASVPSMKIEFTDEELAVLTIAVDLAFGELHHDQPDYKVWISVKDLLEEAWKESAVDRSAAQNSPSAPGPAVIVHIHPDPRELEDYAEGLP